MGFIRDPTTVISMGKLSGVDQQSILVVFPTFLDKVALLVVDPTISQKILPIRWFVLYLQFLVNHPISLGQTLLN